MGNLEDIEERNVSAVYASVSWPGENLMKIEGMMIFDDQQVPVARVGGLPMTFKIDRSRKNIDRYFVALLACKGDTTRLMKLSPDKIFLLDDEAYEAALRKWGYGTGSQKESC